MDERERLQSADADQRAAAAEALSQMGPDAAYAAVELVAASGDQESVGEWSVAALEELGPPPEDAIAGLSNLIADTNPTVAYWAMTLLGRAGPTARSCENQLTNALHQSDQDSVRERAAWALGKIGATSENAVQALQTATTTSNPRLTRLAKRALQEIQS
jgi:HEAT repeat protein